MAIQVLGEPDVATADSYLLMVRVWDPETWSLTAPVELLVPKTASLDQVGAVISAKVGVERVNLEVCKIASAWNFSRVQLPYEQWTKLHEN